MGTSDATLGPRFYPKSRTTIVVEKQAGEKGGCAGARFGRMAACERSSGCGRLSLSWLSSGVQRKEFGGSAAVVASVVMRLRKDCCWKQDAGHGSCNAAGLRVKKGDEEEAAA